MNLVKISTVDQRLPPRVVYFVRELDEVSSVYMLVFRCVKVQLSTAFTSPDESSCGIESTDTGIAVGDWLNVVCKRYPGNFLVFVLVRYLGVGGAATFMMSRLRQPNTRDQITAVLMLGSRPSSFSARSWWSSTDRYR